MSRYGTDDSVNWENYTHDTFRTIGEVEGMELLAMSAAGLAGETGEIIELLAVLAIGLSTRNSKIVDSLKKNIWQNHPFSKEKLTREIGDMLWYLAVLMESCDISFVDALAMNYAKLIERYPDGFDSERSLNREE